MYIKTLLCLTLSVVSADMTIASTYAFAEQQEVIVQTTPAGETTPVVLTAVVLTPVVLTPVVLTPVVLTPAALTSDTPSSVASTPVEPTQLTPSSVSSISVAPTPLTPALVASTPVAPIPLTPSPAASTQAPSTPHPLTPARSTPVIATRSASKPKPHHHAKNEIDTDQFFPMLPDESQDDTTNHRRLALQGSATYYDISAKFDERIHRLTKSALDQDQEYRKTAKAVDHYRTNVQRALRTTKDAVNYVYPYRGFSMSIEGSRVILDEKQKLNNLFVAELIKQRYWDEMHPKVVAQIMQIAQGLGMEGSEQADAAVQKGVAGLKSLTDAETAEATLKELSEWKNQLNIREPVFQQSAWDVESTERIYQNALKVSADGDPLIHQVFKTVRKYQHGKVACMAAGAIEANLSAVTILSGNPFASLAAEGLNTAFVMTTGGPEENKILKELYFGRRLEIRRKRIYDETQLALTNYQKALLTHNAPQLAMSEMVLSELVGPEKIAMVLEHDPIDDTVLAAPIELAKKDTNR